MKLTLPKIDKESYATVGCWAIFVLVLGYEGYLLFGLYHSINTTVDNGKAVRAVRIDKKAYFDAESTYNAKVNYIPTEINSADPFARNVAGESSSKASASTSAPVAPIAPAPTAVQPIK